MFSFWGTLPWHWIHWTDCLSVRDRRCSHSHRGTPTHSRSLTCMRYRVSHHTVRTKVVSRHVKGIHIIITRKFQGNFEGVCCLVRTSTEKQSQPTAKHTDVKHNFVLTKMDTLVYTNTRRTHACIYVLHVCEDQIMSSNSSRFECIISIE